ncbi:MAG: YdcF family protein [Clostridia bacterium]|nr:YdcF family protein [Clostridia bacterium]
MKKSWFSATLAILVLAAVLAAYQIGGLIMSGSGSDNISASEKVHYVIILGCQLEGDEPGRVLQSRIDAAVRFLEKYPNAVAICTGGQGKDELRPEATAIEKALVASGISQKRILKETTSVNTYENLKNAKALIEKREDTKKVQIAVVTSEYHLYRSRHLAQRLGFQNPIGIAAKTPAVLFYPNFLREICSMVAAWVRYW